MLAKVRSLVNQYLSKQLNDTALFWADKALTLSKGDVNDLAAYAQTLHLCGQYRRAIHLLESQPVFPQSSGLKYLAARSHAACKEWEEVIALLKPPVDDYSIDQEQSEAEIASCTSLGDVRSASFVLLGQAYDGLGSTQDAVTCYKDALMMDVFCVEALERLCCHYSLTADEEKALLADMPLKKQCSVEEERLLKFLYQCRLSHARKGDISQVHESLQPLCSNLDVQCSVANRHFQNMNIDACFAVTHQVLEKDPYHNSALLLHIACCVQKEKTEDLFSLGHQLVNHFPHSALAWYAVGCYYIVVKKHQSARKYLMRSVSLDSQFAPAHMAFGLSFADDGEHDQAIAAFSNAARVMKGSHLPLMHLGKEYYLTGAVSLSTRFLKSALAIAPHDPSLLQEVGVMLSNSGNYEKSEKYFKQAITQLQAVDPHVTLHAWEPVYNNLGHIYRKQKKYSEALKMHRQALQLAPNDPDTLTAIAYVHLLNDDPVKAVQLCHQSLRLRREDTFTLDLHRMAMESMAAVGTPGIGGFESLDELEPGSELIEVEGKADSTPKVGGAKPTAGDNSSSSSNDSAMAVDA